MAGPVGVGTILGTCLADPAPAELFGPGPERLPRLITRAEADTAWLEEATSAVAARSVMRAGDADDLRWYYRTGGHDRFSASASGRLWERAELFARHARPCLRCGGDDKLWKGGTGFEIEGWTKPKPARPRAPVKLTLRERDALVLLDMTEAEFLASKAAKRLAKVDGDLRAFSTRVCRDCKGHGWKHTKTSARRKITARPMGSSIKGRSGKSVEVRGEDMARLGRVSRRLDAVRRLDARAPPVLESYYSEDGGTLLSLWWLTPAGRTMLHRNGAKLQPAQFFENERVLQELQPEQGRDNQFKAAEAQARMLLDEVVRAWNEARER